MFAYLLAGSVEGYQCVRGGAATGQEAQEEGVPEEREATDEKSFPLPLHLVEPDLQIEQLYKRNGKKDDTMTITMEKTHKRNCPCNIYEERKTQVWEINRC